jgi:hypothetical protein
VKILEKGISKKNKKKKQKEKKKKSNSKKTIPSDAAEKTANATKVSVGSCRSSTGTVVTLLMATKVFFFSVFSFEF